MTLWSWGANSHGQLGQGEINEQIQQPTIVLETPWEKVKKISCGGGHTLLIGENGRLYACGWNHKMQLGLTSDTLTEFSRVWTLSGIVFTNICCGWDFSCGITNDKLLIVWGSNNHGQLGLPREHFPAVVKPTRLQVNAVDVAMGLRHTAIVNSKGEIWTTGCGKHGQLGLGKEKTLLDRFEKVPNVADISHLACGQNFTVAWSQKIRKLFVWGDNRFGQLLLSQNKYKKIFDPQKIDIDIRSNVKKLACGWTNVALLLEDGRLFVWGRNNYGQLGIDTENKTGMTEIVIPGCQIEDIDLGSEHSICSTADGTLWSWGWNEHSNAGFDNCIETVKRPTNLQLDIKSKYSATNVFAGGGHNFVIVNIENYLNCLDEQEPDTIIE